MKQYITTNNPEDVLRIIVTTFEEINKSLDTDKSELNWGRYRAMIELLRRLDIYEINRRGGRHATN